MYRLLISIQTKSISIIEASSYKLTDASGARFDTNSNTDSFVLCGTPLAQVK